MLLGLLIAVASGFVLASAAAGRRTDTAFPRYLTSHGYDAIVYTVNPLLKRLPGVAQLTPVQMPFYDQPGQADFARFEAVTSRLDGAGVQDLDRPAATITNSIHPQAIGWLVLAGLTGLTAVAMVGQALARQASAALARHVARNQDNASKPTVPAALVNFGASAAFPLLLGGVVAVCGLAALAHLLVVSVTRRRTETGLLRALGMVRRALASCASASWRRSCSGRPPPSRPSSRSRPGSRSASRPGRPAAIGALRDQPRLDASCTRSSRSRGWCRSRWCRPGSS